MTVVSFPKDSEPAKREATQSRIPHWRPSPFSSVFAMLNPRPAFLQPPVNPVRSLPGLLVLPLKAPRPTEARSGEEEGGKIPSRDLLESGTLLLSSQRSEDNLLAGGRQPLTLCPSPRAEWSGPVPASTLRMLGSAGRSSLMVSGSRFRGRLGHPTVDPPLLQRGRERMRQADLSVTKRGDPPAAPNLDVDGGGVTGLLRILLGGPNCVQVQGGSPLGAALPHLKLQSWGVDQPPLLVDIFQTQVRHVRPPDAAQFVGVGGTSG